jgi:hypothetical protein
MASITATDLRKHQNPCSGSFSQLPERRNHSRDDFAKAGYERVQEIEDPELAQKRVKERYITKKSILTRVPGKNVRGIAVRYSN